MVIAADAPNIRIKNVSILPNLFLSTYNNLCMIYIPIVGYSNICGVIGHTFCLIYLQIMGFWLNYALV